MVNWGFGDFRTINKLDISNTNMAKAKMNRLGIVTVSS